MVEGAKISEALFAIPDAEQHLDITKTGKIKKQIWLTGEGNPKQPLPCAQHPLNCPAQTL